MLLPPVRGGPARPLPAQGAAVAPGHVRRDVALVDEYPVRRGDRGPRGLPRGARRDDVLTRLLGGAERPCFHHRSSRSQARQTA